MYEYFHVCFNSTLYKLQYYNNYQLYIQIIIKVIIIITSCKRLDKNVKSRHVILLCIAYTEAKIDRVWGPLREVHKLAFELNNNSV